MTSSADTDATREASRRLVVGYGALVLASLLWAGTGIAGKSVFGQISPAALAFLMWFGGASIGWLLAGREVYAQWSAITKAWKVMLAIGCMSTSVFFFLVFEAFKNTTANTHALLNASVPVWVLLINWIVFSRAPKRREIAGFLLSIGGVVAIIFRGELANVIALRFNIADLLILLAMLIWSGHIFLLPYRPRLSPMAFLAVTGTVGALVVAPFYAWDLAKGVAHSVFTLPVLISIFYVVILRTVFATIVFNLGVDRVGPVRSAPFTHLVPIFGTIGAYFLLGEAVYWYHAVGLLLVLVGILVANRRLA
ncbi:MAG: DMT family transporter [Betaproteobacteria bacterium]|nr:DMT family transporter [Betaproteobacteria bacterium]